MRVHGLRRGDHLFVRRVRPAHSDILAHGARAQPGLLQHHTEAGTQRGAGHGAGVHTAQPDLAAVRIVETHDEIDERGLAAARRADDRDALAVFDGEREITDELALGRVGEIHVFELHRAVARFGFERGIRVGDLLRRFDQLEQPLRAGERALQLGHDAGDLVEGLGVLVRVAEEGGKPADGQPTTDNAERAEHRNARVDQRIDEARGGVRERRKERRADGMAAQALVDRAEALFCRRLIAEGADELLLRDVFIRKRGRLAPHDGLVEKAPVGALCDKACHKQRERREQHHRGGDQRVDAQHKGERADDGHDAGEKLGKAEQ